MRRRQIEAVWHRVGALLHGARTSLPPDAAASRRPGVRPALRKFEECAREHEWEIAWDALADAASRLDADAACWRLLAESAALMGLHEKREAAERALAGGPAAER